VSLARYLGRRDSHPHGIGFYLITLIVLAVVPLALIAAVLVARQAYLQRVAFERSLLQTSLALSVAVDRQLDSYRVMLETLAQDDDLARGNIDGFHTLSARVAARHGAIFVSLFDREGRQIFNTLRPPGALLPSPFNDPRVVPGDPSRPPVGDPTWLQRVLATGETVNSDLLYGLVGGRLLFTVNIPVLRDGKVAYVLNAAFAPEVMTRLLMDNPEFSGVPAVIYDRQGFIVGRWKDADKYVGTQTTGYRSGEVQGGDSGVGLGRTLEGLEVYYSYARSPRTGWGVNVGTERSQLAHDIWTNWAIGGVLAALGLVSGVLLALRLASRLRKSIAVLADSASRNEPPSVTGLRTHEVVRLEGALRDAAAVREAQAQERESRMVAEARKTEAEEANRMKDQFIAVLSHELRNPLAPIRNSVYLLRKMPGDAAPMREIVDMLDRQTQQLTRLVNDLLDAARISSGKITLRRERVDLCLVARNAIESALPGLDARRHRLVRDFSGQPVYVSGDFARLSQVVSNLLDNAAKYTPDGGEIRLSVKTEGVKAVLAVQDNGRGIDTAFLPRLFTGVLQVQAARSEGGLGLGLSLSRMLIERQGGTLEAESEGEGKGSRFSFRLPLSESGDVPVRAAPAAAAPPLTVRRVLVVDDNVDAASMLNLLLKSLGHQTSVAHDGYAALAMAAEFRPDVVLLDIGMPGLDGYEVARRLRAMQGERALKIVAITGWGQQSDKQKTQEAGFDLHLVKPVSVGDLAKALEQTAASGV
jgi:signal transduction histidine kinase/CheY-like chemotaxis protein